MPMPKVTTSVIDLSTRVNAVGTYNSAIVVAAKKGPVDTPTLVTSQTDFLETFTPDETLRIGWDTALYEAYIYLAQQSNLYVVRAANTTTYPALYGGCHIRKYNSEETHESLENGFAALDKHTYTGEGGVPDTSTTHYDTPEDIFDFENDAMIIYGSSQGAWNNDIAVTIITDPDRVKLDGAFIVNVYKNKALVETWTCSLDPELKNGYGVNCYAETILRASNYIRADVNDETANIMNTAYQVELKGSVDFENKVVTAIKSERGSSLNRNDEHGYRVGDIIRITGIDGITAYYICTIAGTTAKAEDIPAYTENGAYKLTVRDAYNETFATTFELAELVKPYGTNTAYNAGDIVSVGVGNTTLYYRAWNNGITGDIQPTFGNDIYKVKDGEDDAVIWVAQTQTEDVNDIIGYTTLEKVKGASYDYTQYDTYADEYLAALAVIPEKVTIDDPTGYVKDRAASSLIVSVASVEKTINYDSTFTGNIADEHYCLPKASSYDAEGKIIPTYLNGGYDGAEPTNVERIRALKTLKNMNDVNIQLIMDGGNTTPTYQRAIDEVCEYREMSCKGIISTPYVNEIGMVTGDAQKDVVDYRKYTLNVNTRNLALYTTHQLVYDEFNDRNIYVSPSCFVAARIMSIAQEYGWHWAAAGYNRGVINSLDVANIFDPSEVDTFSDAQINTIIKEPGMGNIIFDELCLLSKASDMQDLHNSLYVDVYLRPRLKEALKQYLFEFNDEQTRMLITKMLDTFMQPEIASRALYDYRIVCDETNNRPRDIQNNICNVWIFVKLMKLMKFIKLSLIVTPYSVSFDDAAGSAG